ncbi:MAG: ATP-binding protein, partial [Deltaproteobacteria bacterium]|nr:ATP-binding protein [Deltaproteobacteria bacterium]
MIERTVLAHLDRVLRDWGKIALLSGPRQVGKTTLARQTMARFGQASFLNWDVVTDQKRLVRKPYFFEAEDQDPGRPFLVALDEFHKYPRWRSYLKGAWDAYHDEFRFLVTGSGRLDLFRKGTDSLVGRAFGVPLDPLSIGELRGSLPDVEAFRAGLDEMPEPTPEAAAALDSLLRFSGFPEPFLRADPRFYRIWFQDRRTMLIRQDVRDATRIRDISLLEVLSHLVPGRVGSPLSLNSLREDVGVAFETVREWIEILCQFYYCFRIAPFAGSLARALRKESKVYLYDWVEVEEPGARFENLVAVHLNKAVKVWRATGAGEVGLHYVREG